MKNILNWKIFILVIIIIFILISGCISNEENNKIKNNTEISQHSCIFGIEIKLNNTDYFKIKIPIAINQDGSINEVMNNLSFIEGFGNYSIIEINNEFALELSGKTNIKIENTISVDWDENQYPILSLRKNTSAKNDFIYKIFLEELNSTNWINIHIFLITHFSYENYDAKYQFDIKNVIFPPINEKEVKGNFKIGKS